MPLLTESGAQPSEASENTVHRASLESSSTTEASEVTIAPTSLEKTGGENVSSVSPVAGTPSLPGLAIGKEMPSGVCRNPKMLCTVLRCEFSNIFISIYVDNSRN